MGGREQDNQKGQRWEVGNGDKHGRAGKEPYLMTDNPGLTTTTRYTGTVVANWCSHTNKQVFSGTEIPVPIRIIKTCL